MSEYEAWTIPTCRLGESGAGWTPSSVLCVQGPPSHTLGHVCYADLVVIWGMNFWGVMETFILLIMMMAIYMYVYIYIVTYIHGYMCL